MPKIKPIINPNQRKANKTLEWLNKDISFSGNKLGDKQKESFFSELSILLSAGVDIRKCIELIADEQKKDKEKQTIVSILNNIIEGKSLSSALQASGKFSSYEIQSIKIGEESGKLAYILQEISLFYKRKIKQRRQIIQALTYPVLVVVIAFTAIFFMMHFIIPMFADIFLRFGGDLPFITRVIIGFSEFLSDALIYLFAGTILLIAFVYTNKQKLWYRKLAGSIILRLPLAGDIVLRIYLAKFCQSLQLLLSSKIPLIHSIQLVKQMIGFYPIEATLNQVEQDILAGSGLHESLAKHRVYNKRMVALIKVGEEVNKMETIFDKLAQQYSEEAEHKVSLLSSVLEPAMIIFLGLMVGIILIAMYLPLFQLSTIMK